ncbi:unnamed protein product [Orchesella dallaii]|uniref:CRAL-TRIO domain-containing protein n=1 Tax=Orchesella dallaii TaxID=48710 RepID=A0ABP1RM96_9HEXA
MFHNNLTVFSTLACFVILLACFEVAYSVSFDKEITLTSKEKASLEDFKRLMIPKIPESSYVYKFANDDLYLLKWLQASDFNVKNTEKLLTKHLEWRAKENIDTIDTEDWEDFRREHPFYINTVDKQGRPLAEFWLTDWNIRKSVLAGKLNQISRSMVYCMETQTRQLFETREKGSNITQATLLMDLEGVNIIQHICPSCLPVYVSIATNLEAHYPFLWNRIYLMNMPASFEPIVRLVRPIMRQSTRSSLKSYGNKEQWLPLLDETIDKNQRSLRFGGTLTRE